jgi:hypothetical protein
MKPSFMANLNWIRNRDLRHSTNYIGKTISTHIKVITSFFKFGTCYLKYDENYAQGCIGIAYRCVEYNNLIAIATEYR